MTGHVMTDVVQRVFLAEIKQQCDFALQADSGLAASLQRDSSDDPWFYIHAVVRAAANVSRLLWNRREKISGRCETLREVLGVKAVSPLSSRALRNILEHYDERIEKWAMKSTRHNAARCCIGSPRNFNVGPDERDYHLIYDPVPETLWFWGKGYELRPILDELRKIKETLAVPQPN